MPQSRWTTWNGNQRVIAIPAVPQSFAGASTNAVATVDLTTLSLGANNITNLAVFVYIWTLGMSPKPTAAASAITADFIFQFRTAAHVNVGGTIFILGGGASSGAAGQPLNMFKFEPCAPIRQRLAVPATATELVIQANVTAIAGAPAGYFSYASWGLDPDNNSAVGSIGGPDVTAQTATSPNGF